VESSAARLPEGIDMGLWSAYFFAKLLLFAGGYIGFHAWLNLGFAVFTALPPQNKRQRFTKNLVAVPLGVALLYHDSWLPPLTRVLSQLQNLAAFTLPYLLELAGRFINWQVLIALVVMLGIYSLAQRKLRLSTFVFIAIIGVMIFPRGWPSFESQAAPLAAQVPGTAPPEVDARNMRPEALDGMLAQFYAKEQQRQVRFNSLAPGEVPYDIVLLHVCSLSWDDLKALASTTDPLLRRFDIVLSRFNSAASYSGPAAIRLLRGNCGQTTHKQLYEPAAPECLVMDGFEQAGFQPQWLMNHDGHFGDFFSDVRERGGVTAALEDPKGARIAQRAFDDAAIYDDYSVLSRWWQKRQVSPASHVALYYNSISLHDGNRVEGGKDSSFEARLAQFASDIERFLDDLARSGRHSIVVFIPEHGAALQGDRRQISGLREIPTPAITRVPVGIVLVNASLASGEEPQRVESPASYLAVNELLSRFVADNPFARTGLSLSAYTQNLPSTEAVAENDGTVMMEIGRQFMMRTPDGAWSSWDNR
jgi:cellulose synthase operon protein YhjU